MVHPYEKAFKNAIEVLELLIEDYQISGESLPIPIILREKFA